MEIITNTVDFYLEKETAVAIGKFDGVHVGHRRLLEEIIACKSRGLQSCIFTFDPPASIFFGQTDGKVLTTKEEKRLLFKRLGIDILVEFPLTDETAAMHPEKFVYEVLAKQMNARFVAAGEDLSFGAGGKGDVNLLMRKGAEFGIEVKTIEKVCIDALEVSSTLVRSLVEKGDMRYAEECLGVPYFVMGEVVKGNQIGRTIGFPTVNLMPPSEKLLPPNGVYFSKVRVEEKTYRGITNVGCKPTVSDKRQMGVETYLYDFDGNLYGERIEVALLEFKRPEKKFASLDELKVQLEADIAAGAEFAG